MNALFKFTAWVVALPAAISYGALVVSTLWSWFVVPIFGAPLLPVPGAIGLEGLVGLMVAQRIDRPALTPWRFCEIAFVAPTLTLGIAWCAKQFL